MYLNAGEYLLCFTQWYANSKNFDLVDFGEQWMQVPGRILGVQQGDCRFNRTVSHSEEFYCNQVLS